jgi:hypothetical protein
VVLTASRDPARVGAVARTAEEVLDEYGRRYLDGDTAGVVALCEVPFLAVRDGDTFHLPDAQAVLDHFQAHIDAYHAAGGTAIERVSLDLQRLGERSCIATVCWHVLGRDHEVVKERITTYHLVASDGNWRILSYTNHDG